MSSADRTNELAIQSTPFSSPNLRFVRSFSVTPAIVRGSPGTANPLDENISPPTFTRVITSVSVAESTLSSIFASSRYMSWPFLTWLTISGKGSEASVELPSISAVVNLNSWPATSFAGWLVILPMRSFGPDKS